VVSGEVGAGWMAFKPVNLATGPLAGRPKWWWLSAFPGRPRGFDVPLGRNPILSGSVDAVSVSAFKIAANTTALLNAHCSH